MTKVRTVVETGVYADDLEAAEAFYRDVLGLKLVHREAGHHVFFYAGDRMLLVFRPDATLKGDVLPAHGPRGPGHFALGIDADAYDDWKRRLAEQGVPIEQEVSWPPGARSIYFRDPAGNAVELVTPGLWGLPSGW